MAFKLILLCCLAYFFMSICVFGATFDFIHIMMAWNLFLAFLPLLFAKLSEKNFKKFKKLKVTAFRLLWLFFFPNALYLITDFIHINKIKFYSKENSYAPFFYSSDIIAWIKLVHIGLGVFLGTLIGLLSLYIIHQSLLRRKSKTAANIIMVIICLLSGYAIYIGRFLRLNSWDILRPLSLLSKLINNITPFSIKFSLLFAGYILAAYFIFYVFFHNKTSGDNI